MRPMTLDDHRRIADVASKLPADACEALRQWESENLPGDGTLGTSDWPGWKDYGLDFEAPEPEVAFDGNLMAGGFAPVPHSVIRSRMLPADAKLLLILLISRADRNGSSYQGQEGMALCLGMSLSSIKRALGTLRASGLVSIKRRGQGKSALYVVSQLALDRFISGEPSRQPKMNRLGPDSPDRTAQTVHNGPSKQLSVSHRRKTIEEYSDEEKPERALLGQMAQSEPEYPDGMTGLLAEDDPEVWPEWYSLLWGFKGFKRPLGECQSWLDGKQVTSDQALRAVLWLRSTTKRYSDYWRAFQNACLNRKKWDENDGQAARASPGWSQQGHPEGRVLPDGSRARDPYSNLQRYIDYNEKQKRGEVP